MRAFRFPRRYLITSFMAINIRLLSEPTRSEVGIKSCVYDECNPHVIFFFAVATSAKDAKVAELADAPDLGSGTERCGGSSPPFRTKE